MKLVRPDFGPAAELPASSPADHEESLELRKIYEVLDDPAATRHNMIRVIDEEGEDYLYPRDLPHDIEEAILELAHP